MARMGAIRKNRMRAECTRNHFDAMRSESTRWRWLCMSPSSLAEAQPVDADEPVEHEIEHGREDHEIRRQRAGQPPVELFVGLRRDQLADHFVTGTAQQCRRDVVTQREHEYEE